MDFIFCFDSLILRLIFIYVWKYIDAFSPNLEGLRGLCRPHLVEALGIPTKPHNYLSPLLERQGFEPVIIVSLQQPTQLDGKPGLVRAAWRAALSYVHTGAMRGRSPNPSLRVQLWVGIISVSGQGVFFYLLIMTQIIWAWHYSSF